MNRSENIADLAAALAKAQGEIKGAVKDATNPHFRNKYADLSSVWDACRDALTKNGLAVAQIVETDDRGAVVVETVMTHASGQFLSGRLAIQPSKAGAQEIGSVTTYARRYGLAAMVGVAPEDDDGEGAEGRIVAPNGNSQHKGSAYAPTPTAPKAETKADATAGLKAKAGMIKAGIAAALNPEGLEALMKAHGDTLAEIKASSSNAYEHLMECANKRRAEISQAPIPDKEAA